MRAFLRATASEGCRSDESSRSGWFWLEASLGVRAQEEEWGIPCVVSVVRVPHEQNCPSAITRENGQSGCSLTFG